MCARVRACVLEQTLMLARWRGEELD
eukprot:COSAG01_NODE_14413_length_1456_cov_40.344141_1_plen_25_part_10